MKKYIFFTNIPTPYRNSFYNALYRAGFNFEVYYMRNTEADRNWTIDQRDMQYPYYINEGFYRMIGHYHMHFNPKIVIKILKAKGAEIIIGGGWNDIDVLLLVILKRIGILKSQFHFWSEANYLTIGAMNDNLFKKCLRKFVYNSSNGAQLSSGKMTELTFDKWGMKNYKYINFPNTIEEEKFQITEEKVEIRYKNSIPIFLMPVRLIENIKGIINFFKSIGGLNICKGLFLIAGDGPDKESIQSFICLHGFEKNIKLLGFRTTEEMVSLYERANVLVLPSFSDPSPLTLVEALAMKLPLLVSERCGNHFEAVINGKNGYLFNPSDPSSIKRAFESLMRRSDEWRSMGEISGSIYHGIFNRQVVIENFIKKITVFSNA